MTPVNVELPEDELKKVVAFAMVGKLVLKENFAIFKSFVENFSRFRNLKLKS